MLGKTTLVLVFVLLVWGNIVAGIKAGLGCPDWPLCYGSFIPPYRWDTYAEFIHRVLGALTIIFVFALAISRYRTYERKLVPVFLILLSFLEILLGGLVVIMELPPWLSTAHLGNALLIFILILYLNYFDGLSKKPEIIFSEYRWIFGILMFLFFAQSVYGGYVRHSGAGLGCPDFPRCLGYWIPPLLSGITWIHFLHRVFAVGILAVSLGFLLFVRWHSELRAFYRPIIFITLLFTVQIVTGIFVVITQLSFVLAAIHLALALIILMLISNIIFRAKEFGMT